MKVCTLEARHRVALGGAMVDGQVQAPGPVVSELMDFGLVSHVAFTPGGTFGHLTDDGRHVARVIARGRGGDVC